MFKYLTILLASIAATFVLIIGYTFYGDYVPPVSAGECFITDYRYIYGKTPQKGSAPEPIVVGIVKNANGVSQTLMEVPTQYGTFTLDSYFTYAEIRELPYVVVKCE